MYKIAILGCENSHANIFLDLMKNDEIYNDIEVVGVYSEDMEAAENISKQYGVYAAKDYAEFAGIADGVMITARHGDKHYKYALPYIKTGIPMFIDKPITISEKEALELTELLKVNNVRVSGGSVCKYPQPIKDLKRIVADKEYGEVYGGMLRAPVMMKNDYGDFFFYSQHLVQAMCEIFGYNPQSVKAYVNDKTVTCVVRYAGYDVTIVYVDGNYKYYAGINCENKSVFESYSPADGFNEEFNSFYRLLRGGRQEEAYEDFIASVFILNAIERSIKNGTEEKIGFVV